MTNNRQLTGIQTSGGRGTRFWPLNLAGDLPIPKGFVQVMGNTIAEIQLEQFKEYGITDINILTNLLPNRLLLDNIKFGNGSHLGLNIQYSNPHDDLTNNGSGDAIVKNLETRALSGFSFVLPNDNVFELSYESVMNRFEEFNPIPTIAIMSIPMNPRRTIGNYGLIKSDANHKVIGLNEKPKNEQEVMDILEIDDPSELNQMRVPVNTAAYIINNDVGNNSLSKIIKEDWVIKGRRNPNKDPNKEFDMASKLVSGLVERGYPVYHIPIDNWGDLGSTSFFLNTFVDILAGKFPSIHQMVEAKKEYFHDHLKNNWIHYESFNRKDKDGKTLQERIVSGDVKLGYNVFIDKGAVIGKGVRISHSNLEQDAMVEEGAELSHAYLSPYCRIGPHAYLGECALSYQVFVDSSRKSKTHINGGSIIGSDSNVLKGITLEGVKIFPGYKFTGEEKVFNNVVLKP